MDTLWESADRTWFEDHPDERIYVRASFPSEFDDGVIETQSQFCVRFAGYGDDDLVGIGTHAVVVRMDDLTRMRFPYWREELDGDFDKYPVQAELAEGGEVITLSGLLGKLSEVKAEADRAEKAVTEKYLEDILPAFLIDSVQYKGDLSGLTGTMKLCFEIATDEEPFVDSSRVRPAGDEDHRRHKEVCESFGRTYDPEMFPAVLAVQPFHGFFFRMPFPHNPMKESDKYRFSVSTGVGDGTLGEYLAQSESSYRFAAKRF